MKKQILWIPIIMTGMLHSLMGYSQLKVGSGGLHIKTGATIILNGLQLQPTQDIHIISNILEYSDVPVAGTPHPSVKRVYNWTNAIQTKGLIGIYVPPAVLNGNTFNLLQLAYNPTIDAADYVVSQNSVPVSSSHFVFETTPLITWKQITAVELGTSLPLHLLLFKAEKTPLGIRLHWQTTNEIQVNSYHVLRSSDARNYSPIGKIQSACNGCNVTTDYQFTDNRPDMGKNYYKLRMNETQGTATYSKVVTEQWNGNDLSIIISPNPTRGLFAIQGLSVDNAYEISIFASNGKSMLDRSIMTKSTSYQLNASLWPAGVYLIRLRNENGGEWQAKLLKN